MVTVARCRTTRTSTSRLVHFFFSERLSGGLAGVGGETTVPKRKFGAKPAAAAAENNTEGASSQHTAEDPGDIEDAPAPAGAPAPADAPAASSSPASTKASKGNGGRAKAPKGK